MGKPTICIGKNKDADQLREADQRLYFCYTDSTIPTLLNSKISSFYPASVTVQTGLCQTCSETTLLVFPRGGSNHIVFQSFDNYSVQPLSYIGGDRKLRIAHKSIDFVV